MAVSIQMSSLASREQMNLITKGPLQTPFPFK